MFGLPSVSTLIQNGFNMAQQGADTYNHAKKTAADIRDNNKQVDAQINQQDINTNMQIELNMKGSEVKQNNKALDIMNSVTY